MILKGWVLELWISLMLRKEISPPMLSRTNGEDLKPQRGAFHVTGEYPKEVWDVLMYSDIGSSNDLQFTWKAKVGIDSIYLAIRGRWHGNLFMVFICFPKFLMDIISLVSKTEIYLGSLDEADQRLAGTAFQQRLEVSSSFSNKWNYYTY